MKRVVLLFITLFYLMVCTTVPHAVATPDDDPSVSVIAFPIPLMVESTDSGLFIELTRRIAAREKLSLTVDITNTPRAVQRFATGQYDVIVPGVENMFNDDGDVLEGVEAFYFKRDVVFTLKHTPLYRSIDALNGLRVGLTKGYPYALALLNDPGINTVFVDSDEQNAQLLIANRIDAFVAEQHSGVQAFKHIGQYDQVHYARDAWISELRVFYAFRNTPRGQWLESRFSHAIQQMRDSGELDSLFADMFRSHQN
ncbi:substrate-binding periplasmic protein [Alteromonas sp. CYL-A6]|uniref:substrate-binding periplasmic protein n=1 Tax=Alteromonas nitratireducens TaxID=3390813 RepID=UPI0034A84269